MTDSTWESHAAWWQETFTGGADEEYERQMLPLAAEHLGGCVRVLDLGTGEGQVARCAVAAGVRLVIGVDGALAMVERAVAQRATAERAGPYYARADVRVLPFRSAAFDAVTACLVFEHVDGVEAAISEVARVLRPGGRFLLFLNHPAFQTPGSGWIDDQILDEQYWRSGPYLHEQTTIEAVDSEVSLAFIHRTLSTYVNALAGSGLYLTQIVEPEPPTVDEYPGAATIPRILFVRAEKLQVNRQDVDGAHGPP